MFPLLNGFFMRSTTSSRVLPGALFLALMPMAEAKFGSKAPQSSQATVGASNSSPVLSSRDVSAPPATAPEAAAPAISEPASEAACVFLLSSLPGLRDQNGFKELCLQARNLNGCATAQGRPIYYWDYPSKYPEARKVLVMGLIHGDELASGALVKQWLMRLIEIDPRNSWRFIPVANPDGYFKKTRTNANGVDLNRNFPTRDWFELAHSHWARDTKKNPRRFPGSEPGSEPETKCLLSHVTQFEPDLIVSVHTPYGLVDFDGPKQIKPKLPRLPFKALGTYPGSLGRLMWEDRSTPVLTVELTAERNIFTEIEAGKFQDLVGGLAKQLKSSAKDGERGSQAVRDATGSSAASATSTGK